MEVFGMRLLSDEFSPNLHIGHKSGHIGNITGHNRGTNGHILAIFYGTILLLFTFPDLTAEFQDVIERLRPRGDQGAPGQPIVGRRLPRANSGEN